jgi:cold shock CspA family protein
VTGEADVFVHVSQVQRSGCDSLLKGDIVSYDLGTDRKGKQRAENLPIIAEAR